MSEATNYAAANTGQLTGQTVSPNHFWIGVLLGHLAGAARKYGPEVLQTADALAGTPLGQKVEGYLDAKAEESGLPPMFVAYAGDEARALLAKVATFPATPAAQ